MIAPSLATIRARVEALDPEARMEWEERAAVIEYDGKRERVQAEWLAWQEVQSKSLTRAK